MKIERLIDQPIIRPDMLPGDEGANINGPSLIRVPDWIENPLGKYYLYFAHHKDLTIRMAYAEALAGPWHIYEGGVLHVDDVAVMHNHIASPDVHVDHENKQLLMYFHGVITEEQRQMLKCECHPRGADRQLTVLARSQDGLHFNPEQKHVGHYYLRAFELHGELYAMSWGGLLVKANQHGDYFTGDQYLPLEGLINEMREVHGPDLDLRHLAVDVKAGVFDVYFSCIEDKPEQIYRAHVKTDGEMADWRSESKTLVITSERDWEGAELPIENSRRGAARAYVHELRDPAVYREGDELYLLYSVAGEKGIGIARIIE